MCHHATIFTAMFLHALCFLQPWFCMYLYVSARCQTTFTYSYHPAYGFYSFYVFALSSIYCLTVSDRIHRYTFIKEHCFLALLCCDFRCLTQLLAQTQTLCNWNCQSTTCCGQLVIQLESFMRCTDILTILSIFNPRFNTAFEVYLRDLHYLKLI